MILLRYTFNKVKEMYNRMRDWYKWEVFKRICILDKNEWGFVCPMHVGDTYFICALANALMNEHGGSNFVAIVKKSHEDIPKLFTSITRIVVVDDIPITALKKFSRFTKGQPIYGHYCHSPFVSLLGIKDLHILDLWRAFLRLPHTSELSIPKESDTQTVKNVKTLFKKKNLPESKTLILAPKANSVNQIKPLFWEYISERAIKHGWAVCTNTDNSKEVINGTVQINFRLGEAIIASELAGWVISQRSGFCDLISSANTKLTIIYPRQMWYGGTVLSSSSLIKMGLSKTAEEYEVGDNNFMEIISKIFQEC